MEEKQRKQSWQDSLLTRTRGNHFSERKIHQIPDFVQRLLRRSVRALNNAENAFLREFPRVKILACAFQRENFFLVSLRRTRGIIFSTLIPTH